MFEQQCIKRCSIGLVNVEIGGFRACPDSASVRAKKEVKRSNSNPKQEVLCMIDQVSKEISQ